MSYFFKAASGGGSPAWYDNFDYTTATGQTGVSHNGQLFGGQVVAGASGMCSKIRYRAGDVANTGSKIALLTTGGAILGSGYFGSATSESWVEVDITPVSVTSATTYVIMFCSDNAAGIKARSKSGSGYENYDQSYASFPTGTVSLSATGSQICASMYIG
jgi:hypothetical protein